MTTSVQPAFQPPEPISWTDLIAAGRASLIPQPAATQSTQAAIRRAISTAYYAAFHALTTSNADALIGPAHDQLTADSWIRIYRSLNHGQAKSQLGPEVKRNQPRVSADTLNFADIFCKLQDERHSADYNPRATFTIQAATSWLDRVEAAITDFLMTSQSERAAVAVLTLTRSR
jgi:hypothetical protein